MPLDLLLALTGYVFAMSITPGPNNLMLLTSGVNFGFRRTIPHMAGIALGVLAILALVGMGLGSLLEANPALYTALKTASLVYMSWLAWRIATNAPTPPEPTSEETGARPLSALEAALFQWVNPKAWAMVVTAATAYTMPESYTRSLLLIGAVFAAVNLPTAAAWTLIGTKVSHLLEAPSRLRAFNIAMALLLVASGIPIAWDLIGYAARSVRNGTHSTKPHIRKRSAEALLRRTSKPILKCVGLRNCA